MKLKTFYSNQKSNNGFLLTDSELNHAVNVYRQNIGDEINIISGDEFVYVCKLMTISKKEAYAEIVSKIKCEANPKKFLSVFQCNLKSDKIELLVKSLTEVGVSEFTVVNSENIVKDNLRMDRLVPISIEASKQSGRSIGIKLNDIIDFNGLISKLSAFDLVLIAHEKEEKTSLNLALKNAANCSKIAVIIGPEGGLSDTEVLRLTNTGAVAFGLNRRILRAETACLSISAMVLNKIGEFDK